MLLPYSLIFVFLIISYANGLISVAAPIHGVTKSALHAVLVPQSTALTSLLAGSIAGSLGTLIGYPLDSIKVKAQNLGSLSKLGLIGMAKVILKQEGIRGFYSGCLGVMIGQAFILAAAFASNAFMIRILAANAHATVLQLTLAASFSGFITTFLVIPIERMKVIMQSDKTARFDNYLSCAIHVIKVDGLQGLLFRGFDATLMREVPGYALYFVIYELLKRGVGVRLGKLAPLLCGGAAGILSWIPIYPFDVCKSFQQNNSEGGGKGQNLIQVAQDLYSKAGFWAFWDGITPKLLRAGLVHATTFSLYELIFAALNSLFAF